MDETLDTLGTKAVEVKETLINQGENVKGTVCTTLSFVVAIITLKLK